MIPRAKYISQQNWGFFFYSGTQAQRKPYGDVCKMNEHTTTIYPWTAYRIRISFFPHFVFTPFARRIHKNKSQRGISSPPLSFAIRQGSFPADVAKSVLIRFSPTPPAAAYRSGGPPKTFARVSAVTFICIYVIYI